MLYALLVDNEVSAGSEPIKVLIVDDHAGVRAGIRNLLKLAEDITIIGEAENGRQAIELADIKKPDIILLDVQLPDIRGDAVLRSIHKTQPAMKVLVVSSFNDREYVQAMLDCGANGYITKDEAPRMLLEAIHSIVQGRDGWISPLAIKSDGLGSLEKQILTKRETDILEQLMLDRAEYEIADRLGLDEKLLEKYLKLLMKKFEADSLTALKRIARRIFLNKGA
jgi:DNA-binding NarL/FixJ family response regulator